MKRSKKVVFVSFCILAQGFRAKGIVRVFPSIVKPVVDILKKYEINIIQLPCPEIEFEGVIRKPCGIEKYEKNKKFLEICERNAKKVADLIKQLTCEGYKILAIVGIENSPSCGVNYVFYKGKKIKRMGIFMEMLKNQIKKIGLNIPFVGINVYKIEKCVGELERIISRNRNIKSYLKSV